MSHETGSEMEDSEAGRQGDGKHRDWRQEDWETGRQETKRWGEGAKGVPYLPVWMK